MSESVPHPSTITHQAPLRSRRSYESPTLGSLLGNNSYNSYSQYGGNTTSSSYSLNQQSLSPSARASASVRHSSVQKSRSQTQGFNSVSPNKSDFSHGPGSNPNPNQGMSFGERVVKRFDINRSKAVLNNFNINLNSNFTSQSNNQAGPGNNNNSQSQSQQQYGFYKIGSELAQGAEGDVYAAVRIFPSSSGGKYRQVALKRLKLTTLKSKRHALTELSVGSSVNTAIFKKDLNAMLQSNQSESANLQNESDSKSNNIEKTARNSIWETGRAHPYIVHLLDWFPGPDGPERELFIVMQRCDCGLDDLINGVRECRAMHEKEAGRILKPDLNYNSNSYSPNGRQSLSQQSNSSEQNLQGILNATQQNSSNSPSKQLQHLPGQISLSKHRFSENEIRKLFLQMLEALCFLNRLGIVHRDVKVENILWARHSLNDVECKSGGNYKLCDFGVAAAVQQSQQSQSQSQSRLEINPSQKNVAGTLWTMSPEILRGKIHDSSCDIWSLACVIYEMVFLEKPYSSRELFSYQNQQLSDKGSSSTSSQEVYLTKAVVVNSNDPSNRDNSNHGQLIPREKIPRLKWIYSKDLKLVVSRMFEIDRKQRPTPIQMKAEYSLLRNIVEVPPIYAVPITEDELNTLITADTYVRALLIAMMNQNGKNGGTGGGGGGLKNNNVEKM